jgi:hypothetical protein
MIDSLFIPPLHCEFTTYLFYDSLNVALADLP